MKTLTGNKTFQRPKNSFFPIKHNLSEILPNIHISKNSITLFIREVTEIQKRGQVGVVHDDDDDGDNNKYSFFS